ncbi:rCG59303 [Rattus norvegicus]|uniref:RCG59303 n=1 Tax=Rattus norvegicus TaxID=10116 RepID=A6K7G4_RAT|nr:rCG59303 [Rattus norvegicus]
MVWLVLKRQMAWFIRSGPYVHHMGMSKTH